MKELIKKFWECMSERPLKMPDGMLYLCLINIRDNNGDKPFEKSDRELSKITGMSVPAVRESKKRLKDRGLIDFEAEEGKRKRTRYVLTVQGDCTAGPTVQGNYTVTVQSGCTVPPTVKGGCTVPKKKGSKKTGPELIYPFSSEKFLERWQILCDTPKWKKKIPHALQLSLNKLAKFEEGFAIVLIDEAIERNYQGVVFDTSEEKYRRWKSGGYNHSAAGMKGKADERF